MKALTHKLIVTIDVPDGYVSTTRDVVEVNQEAFREWIQAFHDEEVVGYVKGHHSCPLYNFFNELYPPYCATSYDRPIMAVGSNYVRENTEMGFTYDLPEWAIRFINIVDHPTDPFSMNSSGCFTPILKETALQALQEALA